MYYVLMFQRAASIYGYASKCSAKYFFSFRIFYLIIFLNNYNVHYVNVVYASDNMHAK